MEKLLERPSRLRCEHLVEPLGIPTPRPRLSWIPPRGTRGSSQKAYRIVCSKSKTEVVSGKGTVWDSGVVESSTCHLVPWGGPELEEASRYWWAVKTWNDAESPWSTPARFDTAVFNPSSWKASWISMVNPVWEKATVLLVEGSINLNRYVSAKLYRGIYLRKEFSLVERPQRALAFFCGLGYGELFLNGLKVGDHRLDPGQTDYKLGALYSSFDITDLLVEGANAFGIVLGNGRYIDAYGFGKPRAFLQVVLEYSNGRKETIVSDSSWVAAHGPLLQNGIYSGETYDARLEEEGWAKPDFVPRDSSAWQPVEIVEGHPLRSQTMEPIRATEELSVRQISSPDPGVFIFDFGQNFAGVVKLKVRGPRGSEIRLRFAELLDGYGRLHLGTNRESQSYDTYILKGEGEEMWEPRFTYHGFRYVEIQGYPGTPGPEALTGVVLHSDVESTGAFVCSEPLVNDIHRNILWSQRSNLMSIPTDCPQRGERMGWLGDAQLSSEEACSNFDMAAFYIKYLEDIRLAQKPDGSLSDVVPPYWPLYPADPAWSTAYPTLTWAVYWHYGDASILERHYESIKRYVDFLEASAHGHILSSLGSYGDWCPPGSVYPKKASVEFTSTWYLCHDTFLFVAMAEAIGRKKDAQFYAERARSIAEAFNKRFLLDGGRYATLTMSPIDRSVGQTTQALPLWLDIVPEAQREAVVARLIEAVVSSADRHIDAGIVGSRYLFDVLTACGYADVAWDVVTQKSYPGWGYMVAEGATTLWERWEKLAGMGMNSHNHIMFGTVDAWFYSGLAGLSPLAPGWTKFRVAPKTPGRLSHVSASRMTPRGAIAISWSRSPWLSGDGSGRHEVSVPNGGQFTLRLTVPDGTQAVVEVPYADLGKELREGGTVIWAKGYTGFSVLTDGIVSAEARGNTFVVEVGSGDYEFVVSW